MFLQITSAAVQLHEEPGGNGKDDKEELDTVGYAEIKHLKV